MAESEQNKTEEPTQFKLKRAREKGSVARGTDLGFFSALAGLSLFSLIAGADMILALGETMRRILSTPITSSTQSAQLQGLVGSAYEPALRSIAVFGGTIALIVALFELLQVRGLTFTAHPLKPDFGRLNPAKGLKKLFSMRMLKETLKNIAKMVIYIGSAGLLIQFVFSTQASSIVDAQSLSSAMHDGAMRLLFCFVLLALIFAAIDQVLARRDFLKQMRMSKSELTREVKEREGEPRIKRRRKELHAEFVKQANGLGNLAGSDMLIVNPQHFAVALAYDASRMEAPQVTAKGRNQYALQLKRLAAEQSIPIFEAPPLARALYRLCEKGDPVPASEYRLVVDLYLKVARSKQRLIGSAHA